MNINILAAVLRDEVAEALIAEKFDGAFVCHLGTGDLKVKVLALVASNLHGLALHQRWTEGDRS